MMVNSVMRFVTIMAFLLYAHGVSHASDNSSFQYRLPKSTDWQFIPADNEISRNVEEYKYSKSSDITLRISPINENLLSELRRQGKNKIITQILKGKNLIHQLMHAEPIQAHNVNFSDKQSFAELDFETNAPLKDYTQHSFEKYILYPDGGLHISLRWKSGTPAQLVQNAKSDFRSIQVTRGSP